jgi:uncharacterized protein (TIGR02145 family)
LPQKDGIQVYKVNLDGKEYWLRAVSVGRLSGETSLLFKDKAHGNPAKQAKSASAINDVITVKKEGFLYCHAAVTNYTITGMEMKIINQDAGTLKDIDGNEYRAIRIGSQVWMAENLRTTHFNDSTPIPNNPSDFYTPWYCWYNNDALRCWNGTEWVNGNLYGCLYSWYAVGTKKLAPHGWHVPDTTDWNILQNYLIANGYNWDGTTAGNKIANALAAPIFWAKATTISGVPGNNPGANNASGFSAMPGGYRKPNGDFMDCTTKAFWWTANSLGDSTSLYAYRRNITYGTVDLWGNASGSGDAKWDGFSVRLVRD